MKRIMFLLLVTVFSIPAISQQTKSIFEDLTAKYADQEGFSASMLTREMFDLYIKKRNLDETSTIFDALKKLDYITVISQSKLYANPNQNAGEKELNNKTDLLHETILEHYRKSNYTLFKTEKRMGEDVKVYLNKSNDKIVSLALVTSSSTATNLVELQGDIDLKTVSELNRALNLKGLENLHKLDNSGWGVSSTGIGMSPERIEELVARQREMVESQHNLTDEQRVKFELQAQEMAQKQLQMAEKYREMAERYQREPIFLNYPGDTNTVYFIDGKKVKARDIKELDKEKIESIEVKKPVKKEDKTTIKIKTK